jgi:hypothetical protein
MERRGRFREIKAAGGRGQGFTRIDIAGKKVQGVESFLASEAHRRLWHTGGPLMDFSLSLRLESL